MVQDVGLKVQGRGFEVLGCQGSRVSGFQSLGFYK
jgi:hypothetical protein